jgi:HEAT repeat protein
MRKTFMRHHGMLAKMAGTGLAVVLGLALLAPAAPAQQSDQVKRSMGLTYDSLDAILKDLQNYKFDQGVGAPLALRAYVFSHKDDPAARNDCEAKLLAFVQANPAPGGLMAACRALRLIGGPASVPVLGGMLLKAETTDPARYALERIPGPEADNALLSALGKTKGDVKRGIVFSIGERVMAGAVPALETLVIGTDAALAGDAVKALGRIGTPEAARVLTAYFDKATGAAKGEAASALFVCAAALRRSGNASEAVAIYAKLLTAGLPDVLRKAAFRMQLSLAGEGGRAMILSTLTGKDAVLYEPAIAMIPMSFTGSNIGQVLPLMDKLPEEALVQLMDVLAGYPAESVLPAVLRAAASPYAPVRMEALRSVGKIGNPSVVPMLARRAATTVGDEQVLARETLVRLKGTDVEAAILDGIRKETDDKVKVELVQAAGDRRIKAGKPVLMELVRSGSPQLRLKAVGALKEVSTPADLRDLLALLFTIDEETAREAMQDTVASVALTIPRPLARGDAAENLLAAEKAPRKKADLLRVLGKIGDDTALPLVRRALADPDKDVTDAAVRALADWPTASARDDVYGVAASAANLTHKVLALRAYVRMIGLEPYRQPEGAFADLEKAMALASRPEEKRLVLALLPRFPCEKGLALADSLRGDPAVGAEAKQAADRIRGSLARR